MEHSAWMERVAGFLKLGAQGRRSMLRRRFCGVTKKAKVLRFRYVRVRKSMTCVSFW